jgi:hypothetical protein
MRTGRTVASDTWDGNFGHPYAMWSIYKGLETTIGLNDTTAITNLLTTCGTQDAGDVCNWFEDYAQWLVHEPEWRRIVDRLLLLEQRARHPLVHQYPGGDQDPGR